MKKFLIEQGMKNLKNTLKKVLRIGDVAARYSDSQFIVLLPTCTYESSVAVAKRVTEHFAFLDKASPQFDHAPKFIGVKYIPLSNNVANSVVENIFNSKERVSKICSKCIWHDKCLFYQKL